MFFTRAQAHLVYNQIQFSHGKACAIHTLASMSTVDTEVLPSLEQPTLSPHSHQWTLQSYPAQITVPILALVLTSRNQNLAAPLAPQPDLFQTTCLIVASGCSYPAWYDLSLDFLIRCFNLMWSVLT